MNADLSPSRLAGDRTIADHATGQVQTFFDEIKNGTRNYGTVASLGAQIAQEYRGRCVLELLQNAHDALSEPTPNDPKRISFVLSTSPEPVLLIGNTGRPFHYEDFKGICQLAQSPKDPNKSVGNKGLGFRSVLEVSARPEIWSTTPAGSDKCFSFRFDPAVIDRVKAAAQDLERHGLDVRSPFDSDSSLVDWSLAQLDQFRRSVAKGQIDVGHEASSLSPYQLPLRVQATRPDVQRLLDSGHATVVRLPLDGGRMLARDDSEAAVQSVRKQLDDLRHARSVVFLDNLAELVIEVDGDRCSVKRTVCSDNRIGNRQQISQRQLRVQSTGTSPDSACLRQFRVWNRVVGGDRDRDGAQRIRSAVAHLPNRWPKVQQARVGVAVEDTPEQVEGVFVIFLPTEQVTGTGAHINAPFYGSLDRRQIDFEETYNALILEAILDLCLDTVGELAGRDEIWCARAVMDIIASVAAVGGEHWRMACKIRQRAEMRGAPLDDQAIIQCDRGWRNPQEARGVPDIGDDDPVGARRWREQAAFSVVSDILDGRRNAVMQLLTDFRGSSAPTLQEWINTVERMAQWVGKDKSNVTWDDFLCSLLEVLPGELLADPGSGLDPLAKVRFLPTSDGRQVAASSTTKLFFRPVQGIDDLADSVRHIPQVLSGRFAFLHPHVRIHEGQARSNTAVQKFLEGRFVRTYRTEDILRDVVIPALPSLPVAHESAEANHCAEILAWTLGIVQGTPPDALLPFLRKLPVACYGGWLRATEAIFGPGWHGRHGGDVGALVRELPPSMGSRLRDVALLSPSDERWLFDTDDRGDVLARAGVVDGLPLRVIMRDGQPVDVTFEMSQDDDNLLEELQSVRPDEAYADWYGAMREQIRPHYVNRHEFELSGLRLLPEIHHLATLGPTGRRALSNLILHSIGNWNGGWESVTIRKSVGQQWQRQVSSPLKHWLKGMSWLGDEIEDAKPISQRWLVPESLLRGQSARYAHLDPLALDLVKQLDVEPALRNQLVSLGLKIYPTEGDRTGPELLEALARALREGRVAPARFEMFVGQVREAWRRFDSEGSLPAAFLVREGRRRSFSLRSRREMADVFLPNDQDRSKALRDHNQNFLEMDRGDAIRLAGALVKATEINLASQLEERHEVDGATWTLKEAELVELGASAYVWLPSVLLAVAAYGGNNPSGTTTRPWREAADRLRHTRLVECDEIVAKIVHDNVVIAENRPPSQWLPGGVLAVRRDMESHEGLAFAGQAILNRQDISKDLRLVLGTLPSSVERTHVETALEKAEIDAQAFADVLQQWDGDMSAVVDRIRPVLRLLQVSEDGLEAAARDVDHLTEWMVAKLPDWNAPRLLSAARRSHDDRAMGVEVWRALGEVAQLPRWNGALAKLGDKYEAVENLDVVEQAKSRIEEATPLLRAFARYVALVSGDPSLFRRVEDVCKGFDLDSRWSRLWWELPFTAVLDSLIARYKQIPALERYIGLIEGSDTADCLRGRLEGQSIPIAPDPYETAGRNRRRLDHLLSDLLDVYREWTKSNGSNQEYDQLTEPKVDFDGREYLDEWSDAMLLELALLAFGDGAFKDACIGCSDLDAIRCKLGQTPEAIEARRKERLQQKREAERRRRTYVVAGYPFEVGSANYRDLFDQLGSLTIPDGPCASKDELTALLKVNGRGSLRAGRGAGRGTPPVRPPPHLTELVGVVGEMWAFRYLRSEFGEAVVKHECWVSEIRRIVLPLAEGDPHDIDDSHGFDFRFTDGRGRKWHVEVKATAGDDSSFELGISEIRAATRLARQARRGRWRILRVRNALSEQPGFDLIPNPFEDKFKDCFHLHRGGMRVSYRAG